MLLCYVAYLLFSSLCFCDISIRMPSISINKGEIYICSNFKYPDDINSIEYITEFEPKFNSSAVHHMILYGCEQNFDEKAECENNCHQMFYVWAHNAPKLTLPNNVGFKIGPGSKFKYLQLQMHYKTEVATIDASGIDMKTSKIEKRYKAHIYLLASNYLGRIPGHNPRFALNISCELQIKNQWTVFGIRTHAHALGRGLVGYRYRNGEVSLIGRGNPQLPQAFYPPNMLGSSRKLIDLHSGDIIMARCVYDSSGRRRDTYIGSTFEDEMCNYYLMYYSESDENEVDVCIDDNIPNVWKYAPLDASAYGPEKLVDSLDEEVHLKVSISNNETLYFNRIKEWFISGTPFSIGQVSSIDFARDPESGNELLFAVHRGTNVWDSGSFSMTDRYIKNFENTVDFALLMINPESGVVEQYKIDKTLVLPHSVTVEKGRNEEAIAVYFTDIALHQVFKYAWGKWDEAEMILGSKGIPGNDNDHFCKPTDVKVSPDKKWIFVSDGYCNSRIIKYTYEGVRVTEWSLSGTFGRNNNEDFDVVHSLTIIEKKREDEIDKICAADRNNARIACYTLDGELTILHVNDDFRPQLYALSYNKNSDLLYGINGPELYPKVASDLYEYKISLMKPNHKDKIVNVGKIHGNVEQVQDTVIKNPHAIVTSPDNSQLFVADIFNRATIIKYEISINAKLSQTSIKNFSDLRMKALESLKAAARFPKTVGLFLICLCGIFMSIIICIIMSKYNSSKRNDLKQYYNTESQVGKVLKEKTSDILKSVKRKDFKSKVFGDNWKKNKQGFMQLSTSEKEALMKYESDSEDSEDEIVNTNRIPRFKFSTRDNANTIV